MASDQTKDLVAARKEVLGKYHGQTFKEEPKPQMVITSKERLPSGMTRTTAEISQAEVHRAAEARALKPRDKVERARDERRPQAIRIDPVTKAREEITRVGEKMTGKETAGEITRTARDIATKYNVMPEQGKNREFVENNETPLMMPCYKKNFFNKIVERQ